MIPECLNGIGMQLLCQFVNSINGAENGMDLIMIMMGWSFTSAKIFLMIPNGRKNLKKNSIMIYLPVRIVGKKFLI